MTPEQRELVERIRAQQREVKLRGARSMARKAAASRAPSVLAAERVLARQATITEAAALYGVSYQAVYEQVKRRRGQRGQR